MGTAETNNKLKLTDKVCRRELKTDSEDQKAWRLQTYIKNENEISMQVGRRRGVKLVTCRGNEERKRARHKTLGNCTRIPNTHFRSKVLLQQKKAAELHNPAKFLYMLEIMISCRLLAPWSMPIYLHQTADVKLIRNWAASKCALKFSGTHWASGCWEYPAAKRRGEKKGKIQNTKADSTASSNGCSLSFLSSQGDSNSALEQLCDLYTAGITRNKHGDQFSIFPFSLSSLQKSHITLMCNAHLGSTLLCTTSHVQLFFFLSCSHLIFNISLLFLSI